MSVQALAPDTHRRVISEIAPDFKLLDVWSLPVEGRSEEFDSLVELMTSFDPSAADSAVVRALFAVRHLVGALLGWDDVTEKRSIPGCNEPTLRDRLPEDLRASVKSFVVGDAMERAGLVPMYRTEDEWAGEVSNATVHGVVHLAWVEQDGGRYRGELAVYVKPRGLLGEGYMMLIQPFRHLIVYPALMRQIGRAWDARLSRSSGRVEEE